MPAITLMNDDRKLLGWLLIAEDELLTPNQLRNCVLMGVPENTDLFHTPLCNVIQEHKIVEFVARVNGEPLALTVDLNDGWSLHLSIGSEGAGPWSARHTSGTELLGHCELATKGSD